MLTRLQWLTDDLRGLLDSGEAPWRPRDTGRRAICHNGNPYYCDHGTYRGSAFIPWVNNNTQPWGRYAPCVARCVLRHEFSHGIGDSDIPVECPAVIAEGRCLLDYLMRMRTECCEKFRRYQERIRNARQAFSAQAQRCPPRRGSSGAR